MHLSQLTGVIFLASVKIAELMDITEDIRDANVIEASRSIHEGNNMETNVTAAESEVHDGNDDDDDDDETEMWNSLMKQCK
jgi:hypothetical protein